MTLTRRELADEFDGLAMDAQAVASGSDDPYVVAYNRGQAEAYQQAAKAVREAFTTDPPSEADKLLDMLEEELGVGTLELSKSRTRPDAPWQVYAFRMSFGDKYYSAGGMGIRGLMRDMAEKQEQRTRGLARMKRELEQSLAQDRSPA